MGDGLAQHFNSESWLGGKHLATQPKEQIIGEIRKYGEREGTEFQAGAGLSGKRGPRILASLSRWSLKELSCLDVGNLFPNEGGLCSIR